MRNRTVARRRVQVFRRSTVVKWKPNDFDRIVFRTKTRVTSALQQCTCKRVTLTAMNDAWSFSRDNRVRRRTVFRSREWLLFSFLSIFFFSRLRKTVMVLKNGGGQVEPKSSKIRTRCRRDVTECSIPVLGDCYDRLNHVKSSVSRFKKFN